MVPKACFDTIVLLRENAHQLNVLKNCWVLLLDRMCSLQEEIALLQFEWPGLLFLKIFYRTCGFKGHV